MAMLDLPLLDRIAAELDAHYLGCQDRPCRWCDETVRKALAVTAIVREAVLDDGTVEHVARKASAESQREMERLLLLTFDAQPEPVKWENLSPRTQTAFRNRAIRSLAEAADYIAPVPVAAAVEAS
jgi:hypothetical protein